MTPSHVPPPLPVPIVERLEIEQLPLGHRSDLRVELTRDGLGLPICAPVIVARGAKPGPVFGISAALHGNEVNGIPVIHRLMQRLDLRTLKGTILAVLVANVPAFLANKRRFREGVDLNHIMPGDATGNAAQVYAHRLFARLISQVDYLCDLHTASSGRVNSLYVRADLTHPVTAKMAHLQRPQIILHNPASDRTLRGTAMLHNIPAITIEIGDPQRFQSHFIKRTLTGLRAVLADVGMIPKRPLKFPKAPPVLCSDSNWIYTVHGGLLRVLPNVTDMVAEGEPIATEHDIFGRLVHEYQAPEAGIVIGHSVNPVGQTGARILHLGRVATSNEHGFLHRDDISISDLDKS